MEILLLIIIILLIWISFLIYIIMRSLGKTLYYNKTVGFGDKPNEIISTQPYLFHIMKRLERIEEMVEEKKN